jgi:hypothetical protein
MAILMLIFSILAELKIIPGQKFLCTKIGKHSSLSCLSNSNGEKKLYHIGNRSLRDKMEEGYSSKEKQVTGFFIFLINISVVN